MLKTKIQKERGIINTRQQKLKSFIYISIKIYWLTSSGTGCSFLSTARTEAPLARASFAAALPDTPRPTI